MFSQSVPLTYSAGSSAGYISPGKIPFWLRSDQFGSVPIDDLSMSFTGSVIKDYNYTGSRKFDWGAALDGRLNAGDNSNFILVEGYAKMRYSIFELRGGRSKSATGLRDTTLSSGSFSMSGNALGIPGLSVSIPEFYILPFFGKMFAFQGSLTHGWKGNSNMRRIEGDTVLINTFLHQTTLYGRFGKPQWKWKMYGGFNHQVQWGNEQTFYVQDFTLSPFTTFLYVITGKVYDKGIIQKTRLGDHKGSIDLGFEYKFKNFDMLFYRQNFYEAGALYHLANIQDGLNGVSVSFRHATQSGLKVKKLLFEYLYTRNQAGESWSPPTPSPYENYYNHGHYLKGWTYKNMNLGTPFITSRAWLRDDLPCAPMEYFVNNRVSVLHGGAEGSFNKWEFIVKGSFSKNYGTYQTTDEEQSTNIYNPGQYGIFGVKKQFSAYLGVQRELINGFNCGVTTAFDTGELYYDSFGILFNLSWTFSQY